MEGLGFRDVFYLPLVGLRGSHLGFVVRGFSGPAFLQGFVDVGFRSLGLRPFGVFRIVLKNYGFRAEIEGLCDELGV